MDNLVEQLLAVKKLGFLWSGNNGWIISTNDKLYAFDLDFFNHERIENCELDLELLADKLEFVMITHEHEDHFSTATCEMLLEKSNCQFVLPKSCERKAAEIGISCDRLIVVEPYNEYYICGINLKTTRAVHGHIGGAVHSGATMLDCGYIVDIGGICLYQPGDTILLEEHFSLSGIDVLMVSPTEHNTYIQNTVEIINAVNPEIILPQHHSTYVEADDNMFWTHGYVDEVYEALPTEQKQKYKILTQQQIFEV